MTPESNSRSFTPHPERLGREVSCHPRDNGHRCRGESGDPVGHDVARLWIPVFTGMTIVRQLLTVWVLRTDGAIPARSVSGIRDRYTEAEDEQHRHEERS